jgi:hypothetical protein
MSTQTAGERFGIKGRRTIRRPKPGDSSSTVNHVGLWDLQPKVGSTLARLEKIYLTALDSVDKVEARKTESAKSGRFTPEGLKADTLQFAVGHAPVFRSGFAQIASAKREAARLRGNIKLEPADRTDLVGAMLRAEMRTFLRSKTQKERDDFLTENADKLDPQLALAVMEMPAEITGVSSVQREKLIDRALQAQHGEVMKDVQELERGIEIAERAVLLGRSEIIREAEATIEEFDQLAAPLESRAGVAWLRKNGDGKVITVDLQLNVGREPTPEELETGVFFENYEDYCQANGLKAAA